MRILELRISPRPWQEQQLVSLITIILPHCQPTLSLIVILIFPAHIYLIATTATI